MNSASSQAGGDTCHSVSVKICCKISFLAGFEATDRGEPTRGAEGAVTSHEKMLNTSLDLQKIMFVHTKAYRDSRLLLSKHKRKNPINKYMNKYII